MDHKVEYAEWCLASWQVKSIDGSRYLIKCQVCGTTVASGGVPKCLLNKAGVSGSLPSDEKLIKVAHAEILYNETKRAWWIQGAKFIRDMLRDGNAT